MSETIKQFDQFRPDVPQVTSNLEYINGNTVINDGALQSPNFVKGKKGFELNSDGTARFLELEVGDLTSNNYLAYDSVNGLRLAGALKIVTVLTAGETITGATLPVPVYQDTSDNRVYACDADVTTKLKFLGFAISNATSGNLIAIQTDGIVSGFSALDEGLLYYVQDTAGTIATTQGTYNILVGQAISTTELSILKQKSSYISASNNLKTSANTSRNIDYGSYTKVKAVKIYQSGLIRIKFDLYSPNGTDVAYGKIYKNSVAVGTEQSQAGNGGTTTFSEDFNVTAGDEFQLYGKHASGAGATVSNFKFYYDVNFQTQDTEVITN